MLLSVSVFGIYVAIIILARIIDKRSFSKMSSFDFVMKIAVGSIVASTKLSSTVKMIESIADLTVLYVLQISVVLGRRKKPFKT